MQKSLFPDGVMVDCVALRRTGLSAETEILRSRIDETSRGMVSGGEITINAVDLTRIDVAQLEGYVPNGQQITTNSDYYSILLDDYTLNTLNYVVAIYTEDETFDQPHETDGETYATVAAPAWRIRVYSETNFLALPATDPNLDNDAIDRCLLLGIVSANGAGVNLASSNVTSPTAYNNIMYATPLTFTTIPGVTILGVSSDTPSGTGTLEFYYLPGPTPYYIRWNPVGSAWPAFVAPPPPPPGGGWENFTVDEIRNIPGSTGTYIRVQVLISLLPTTASTLITENVDISNLYYQEIPRQTANDNLHRSYLGTGTPTPTNPHGTSLADLTGSDLGLLDEHQDLEHSNGIIRDSSVSYLQSTISFPLAADQLNITPAVSVDSYYVNGKKKSGATPTSFMFLPAVIPTSGSGTHMYEVAVSDDEVTSVNLKASYDESLGPRTITGTWIVDMSDSYPAATYILSLTVGAGTYDFSWDGGATVRLAAVNDSQIIRLYAEDSQRWIDLLVNTNDVVASPDGNLPGVGAYTDNIIVYASVDWSQHLHLASVPGWWDVAAAPARFAVGFKPYAGTRYVTDRRIWGTLNETRISDSALKLMAHDPQDELHESGVLYRRHTDYYDFAYYGVAGLSLDFRGGAYYCRGKRIEYAGSTVTLFDNETNLVYLDPNGNVQVLAVVADFAASIPNAVQYVIGNTKFSPFEDDDPHAADSVDAPERGVVLYSIVTAGGAISSYTNLMRNVNGPVDPWSVSSFVEPTLSQFDSLYSAFLYANLRLLRDHKIEVKINGPSSITSTITQPLNVDVVGKLEVSPGILSNIVTISTADALGAWRLNQYCNVRGVRVLVTADGGTAFGLASNVTIEGCYYASSGTTNDKFMYSAANKAYVYLLRNYCETRSSFVTTAGGSTNLCNWYIEDNVIVQSANSITSSLIDVRGFDIFIRNNKIRTDNSSSFTTAIGGYFAGATDADYVIEGNVIELGTGAETDEHYGIDFDTYGDGVPKILNNTFKRVSGSASHVGVGVQIDNGSAIIRGNVFKEMGGGVTIRSAVVSGLHIEDNTFVDCYHHGIKITSTVGLVTSWGTLDGVSVRGNSMKGFIKNAGGSGVGMFGADLYGIRIVGNVETRLLAGNINISNNDISTFSTTLGEVYGVRVCTSFSFGGGAITAGYEGISVNGNNIKDLSSTLDISSGIDLYFYAAAGVASVLSCRGLMVSNNNVKGILSTALDAYGIRVRTNLDTAHTRLLNGLNITGNNVAGFWGNSAAPTLAESIGIKMEDMDPLDEVWGAVCSGNVVSTNSLTTVAGGVDNDTTFVVGVYSSFGSSGINGNTVSITGATDHVRGDGIRVDLSTVAVANKRVVVTGNNINVNWTGIHLKYIYGDCSTNKINAKSLGIFLDNTVNGNITGNDIYVVGENLVEYAGMAGLNGYGCIGTSHGDLEDTVISSNRLYLSGTLVSLSANMYMYGTTNVTFDNNYTNQAGAIFMGATPYHIYSYNQAGILSISGNSVNNSARVGASGIYVEEASNTDAIISLKGNKVLAINEAGSGVYELDAIMNVGGAFNPRMYVQENVLHLTAASGAGFYAEVRLTTSYLFAGDIVNAYGQTGGGVSTFGNALTNDASGSPTFF